MAGTHNLRNILGIKAAASAAMVRISSILELQQNWQTDDETLASESLKVRLACEYASSEFEAVRELCHQLISHPPPYSAIHSQERVHQILELDVLVERAFSFLDELHDAIKTLKNECDDPQIVEAEERAKNAADAFGEELPIMAELVAASEGAAAANA